MDAVFMRTDPPVTTPTSIHTFWTTSTPPKPWLSTPLRAEGGKRKMYALQFTNVIPETMSAQINKLSDSLWSQRAAILKPLGNKAGEEFFI